MAEHEVIHTHREPIDELTLEKLAFHPAIIRELEEYRSNSLNLLRTAAPVDVANIARAQAALNILDILLGNDKQPSLAQKIIDHRKKDTSAQTDLVESANRRRQYPPTFGQRP